MPAPGLLGPLTSPTVRKNVQGAGNALNRAPSVLPGAVGNAYKTLFNTATSISSSMASNMSNISSSVARGFNHGQPRQSPEVAMGYMNPRNPALASGTSKMNQSLRASRGLFTK
jgi:hypothetical protein